jgi:hypothetical protein
MPTKIVANPMSPLSEGVDATMRLIADPQVASVTGKFFNVTQESKADPQAYDAAARRSLRALSEKLIA